MNIDRALSIPGWMTAQELAYLALLAAGQKSIVEIGSYMGRSTRALADNTPGFVLAIDDWLGPRDIGILAGERLKVWEAFQLNLGDLITSKKVLPIRIAYDSLPYMRLGFIPDMVFIDGDHEYESVKRDIEWAKSMVQCTKLSVICGHDFYMESVKKATREALGLVHRGAGDLWYSVAQFRWGA